jgi:hypothetical protein
MLEIIEEFQRKVGFALPPSLRAAYLDRGNGGWGPPYGVMGLIGGHLTDLGDDVLSLYQTWCGQDPDDPAWHWPRDLLPICHIGCGMHVCVDAATGAVIQFDPNGYGPGGPPWDTAFTHVCDSIDAWLASSNG